MTMGLEPVGVEAVVRGMADFTGQMGQMQKAINDTTRAADQAGAPLSSMGESITQAGSASKTAVDSQRQLNQAYREAASAASAVGAPIAALGGILTGISGVNVMAAARFEELGIAMNRTAANAGLSAAEMALLEQSLQDTGLSMSGAREFIMRLMQSEIDLSQATQLARAAQDLAVIGMTDSTETANDLAYAISSLNVRVLRKYGIVGNLIPILEEYGRSMGLTGDELKAFVNDADDATQRQAMLNFVLQEAGKFSGVYEDAMGSASKQIRSMQRYLADLSVEFGQALLPVLEKVVFGLRDLLKWFQDLPKGTKEMISQMVALGGALALVGGTALIVIPKITMFIQSIGAMKAALSALSLASGGAGTALGGLVTLMANPVVLAAVAATAAIVGITSALYNQSRQAEETRQRVETLAETYEKNVGELNKLRSAEKQWIEELGEEEMRILKIAQYEAERGQSLKELTEIEVMVARATIEYAEAELAAIAADTEMAAAEKARLTAFWENTIATDEAKIAQGEYTLEILEGINATRQYVAEVNRWNAIADDYAASIGTTTEAIMAEKQAMREAQHAEEDRVEAIRNTTTSADQLAAALLNEADAQELANKGADHGAIVMLEIARAMAEAGNEALSAGDRAMIFYEAIMRVNAAERAARIGEISAFAEATILLGDLTAAYEDAGAAGVSSANQVAKAYQEAAIRQAEAARWAALDIRYWNEDQLEWIADNEAGLTEDLQAEFAARTEAARQQAEAMKDTNADLAMEILDAEKDYQAEKARIMQMEDEEQRAAALAILERENAERLTRAQERADLEAQIEEERLQREIAMMQTAGAAGGKAMADSFATEWEKIKGVFDKTGGWAAEGVVLPDSIVQDYEDWIGDMRQIVEDADWTEEEKNAISTMLDEIEANLDGTAQRMQEDALAVATAWANAGLDMASSFDGSTSGMATWLDDFTTRLTTLTETDWEITMGFDIEDFPEGLLPSSPKSRWQARLEMLDAWASSHTIGIQFAVEGAGAGTGQGAFEDIGQLFGFGGKLGGLGRYFGGLFEQQQIDPLEERAKALTARIEELNEALHSGRIDAGMYNKIMYDLALTEEERAQVLDELNKKQEQYAALQEAQRQFEFLQQQQQLLDLISEYGLNPEDILGGVELGAGASAEEIMLALTRAMEAIVAQGAASFGGAGTGLPGGERGTLAAPMVPMLPPAGGVNVAVGPNYINNGMDEAMFAARVKEIVADAIAP